MKPTFLSRESAIRLIRPRACFRTVKDFAPGVAFSLAFPALFNVFNVGAVSAENEPLTMQMSSSAANSAAGERRLREGQSSAVTRKERAVELNEQGVALAFQGDHQGATASIKQALAYDPSNTTILYNLAGMYLAQGQADEALGIMKSAVTKEPSDVNFWKRLAEAAVLTKNLPAATNAYEAMAQQEPRNGEVSLTLGTLYAMQQRWEEAEATLVRVKELMGEDARVLVNLANVLLMQEKFSDALPLLRDAQEREPCKENAVALALCYEGLGKLGDAIEQYREAKRLGESGEDLERHIERLENAYRETQGSQQH